MEIKAIINETEIKMNLNEIYSQVLPQFSKGDGSSSRSVAHADDNAIAINSSGSQAVPVSILAASHSGLQISASTAAFQLGQKIEILLDSQWGVGSLVHVIVENELIVQYGDSGETYALYSLRFQIAQESQQDQGQLAV